MSANVIPNHLDTLSRLAEREPVGKYNSTLAYWKHLWQTDRNLCSCVIQESITLWKTHEQIAYGLMSAASLVADPELDSFLEQCMNDHTMPHYIKRCLWFVLIHRGSISARNQYVEKFCRNFSDAKEKHTEGVLTRFKLDITDVRDACLLGLRELLPVLEQLQELTREKGVERYREIWKFRPSVDAAVLMFKEGATGLINSINKNTKWANYQFRLECAYCLGCLRDPTIYESLYAIYNYCGTAGASRFTKLAVVDAIVYASFADDVSRFLVAAIRERLSKGPSKSFIQKRIAAMLPFVKLPGDYILKQLLTGVYFAPRLTDDLALVVNDCLKIADDEIAALAYLALEQHGRPLQGTTTISEQSLESERRYLAENVNCGNLMSFRRIFWLDCFEVVQG